MFMEHIADYDNWSVGSSFLIASPKFLDESESMMHDGTESRKQTETGKQARKGDLRSAVVGSFR